MKINIKFIDGKKFFLRLHFEKSDLTKIFKENI